jgi:hypothetical protein
MLLALSRRARRTFESVWIAPFAVSLRNWLENPSLLDMLELAKGFEPPTG